MKRRSQEGVALVITLIMLSVIVAMTVTFLVLARRGGEQVDSLSQQNIAKGAAEGGLQMAEGQIVAGMLGSRNGFNNALIVSTNYVSQGFVSGERFATNLYNVCYTYPNGAPLSQNDQLAMLGNLLYLPRAPVFVTTNNATPPEFRFFLNLNGNVDANGNPQFDTNGLITNLDVNGKLMKNSAGAYITSVQVGDPEWIGGLDHPDQRHSPTNLFLERTAFIAIPIGNSLDINYSHNQSKFLHAGMVPNSPTTQNEAFLRNEGVGSWELNLAAFLENLNSNTYAWGGTYAYSSDPMNPSIGTAFNDAAAILQYRNGGSYASLNSFSKLYGPNAAFWFGHDGVDGYTVGPIMNSVGLPGGDLDATYETYAWSGADNSVQFTRPRDLLTLVPPYPANATAPVPDSFTNHLYAAGNYVDTYDRYTFYRLLSQMGIGSAPEPAPYPVGGSVTGISAPFTAQSGILLTNVGISQMSYGTVPEAFPYPHGGKMNLNYNNVNYAATNFIPWTPVGFFTNAADRLLRSYFPTNFALLVNGTPIVTNISINFIPIYPVNFYTPAVHRMLQLAANMYDASTNKAYNTLNQSSNAAPLDLDYPSVFKPYFKYMGSGTNTIVYISGYGEQLAIPVARHGGPFWSTPLDLQRPADLNTLLSDIGNVNGLDTNDNVYGAPYVVGARAGLPNFNQFATAPVLQLQRTLRLGRLNGALYTNVAYQIGISNNMSVQCWNSYTNYFRHPVYIFATNDYSVLITNNFGARSALILPLPTGTTEYVPALTWAPGYMMNVAMPIPTSFRIEMSNSVTLLPNLYVQINPPLYSSTNVPSPYWNTLTVDPRTTAYFQPDWGVMITNRLRVVIQDAETGRILDCVQMGTLGQVTGLDTYDDLATNLYYVNFPGPGFSNMWNPAPTSVRNPTPIGFNVQFAVSDGIMTLSSLDWTSAPSGANPSSITTAISGFQSWLNNTNSTGLKQYAFSPTMAVTRLHKWSANDPLVHYMVGDLTDVTQFSNPTNGLEIILPTGTSNTLAGMSYPKGPLSPRYQPWNTQNSLLGQISGLNQIAYRDPMIRSSSDWQFPTNNFPNIGWLGRIHRGTPWQTVYMKSMGVDATVLGTWQTWVGNPNIFDAITSQPVSDWQMFDLFTSAPNENAGRGQLSVNQTNMAAWAAVLDGVIVLSNNPALNSLSAMAMDTIATNSNGQLIISSINAFRTNMPGQEFTHVGQILGAPQLSVSSPYITASLTDTNLTDAVLERIPQQIMSLLRAGTPRYAIYSYGQALKPANNSIVQSGQNFGLCTNYQVTGEVMTRAIVRFDNMPVPGYSFSQTAPGVPYVYQLPVLNGPPVPVGRQTYVLVTNTLPPMKAVVESYATLGPEQ